MAASLPANCHYLSFIMQKNAVETPLPFSRFIIKDFRIDTSQLGFYKDWKSGMEMKLCSRNSFANELSGLLNFNYSVNFNPAGDIIYGIIKDVRAVKATPVRNNSIGILHSITLKIDFFLQHSTCLHTLYRVDSTYYDYVTKNSTIDKFISASFNDAVKKIGFLDLQAVKRRRCLSFGEVDSFYRDQKKIPILLTEKPYKGIYLNFEDFKYNKPVITDFEISLSSTADLLYVKGKNIPDSIISDAWGFSDGKNLFIRQRFNFFPLIKAGENFEFYGFDDIIVKSPGKYPLNTSGSDDSRRIAVEAGVQLLLNMIKTRSKDLKLRVLDIETGKIY